MIAKLKQLWGKYFSCVYCGKDCSNVGSGLNMGTPDRPMCERCYENGGDS